MIEARAKAAGMKKLDITVGLQKLGAMRDALTAAGIHGATISEVKSVRRQGKRPPPENGHSPAAPGVRLEILIPDAMLKAAIEAACNAARRAPILATKILVMDVLGIVRIRTGETGEAAV
jgi:nitrogen regulatory protein P-II 1